MIREIYEITKQTQKYSEIEKFIKKNLKLVDFDGEDEAYYQGANDEYELTPILIVGLSYGFDIFGGNKTGGYAVYVKDITTDEVFNIFDHNITVINGEKDEDDVVICDESIIATLQEKEDKSCSFNEETFVSLMETAHSTALKYWRHLPSDVRNKKEYVDFVMEMIYDKAVDKVISIRNYDDISPYGGMDITYFPQSYGECFFDKMQYLKPFMELDTKSFHKLILDFLSKKDEKDSYLLRYRRNVALYKKYKKSMEEILKLYHNSQRRQELFEERLCEKKDELAATHKKIEDLFFDKAYCEEKLKEIQFSKFERFIFAICRKEFGDKAVRKYELLEQIRVLKETFSCYCQDIKLYEKQIKDLERKLKKLSYITQEKRYKDLNQAFVETLDDESYETYVNFRIVSERKYKNFANTLKMYVA